MRLGLSARSAARLSSWLIVIPFWITAVVLSTAQIYFREATRGFQVPWHQVLAANALAWLPWLALAPAVVELERRFPVPGSRIARNVLVHIGSAILVSTSFLVYLGYFHAAYLGGGGLFPSRVSLRNELAEKIGQHFLVAVALYLLIALSSFSYRSWRSSRKRLGPPIDSSSSSVSPGSLIVRSVGKVERVETSSVDWIEGCGNYARLHMRDHTALIRRTLTSLGEELEPAGFVRVHRSAIVNEKRIKGLHPGSHGDAEIELANGQRIKVSRTFRRTLEKRAF